MLEKLLEYDKDLLIFLNNLGTPFWDLFWATITQLIFWSPVVVLIVFLIFKKYDSKHAWIIMLVFIFKITFVTYFTHLIKLQFKRLRPIHDPDVSNLVRFVTEATNYSFFSGHASSSFAIAFFSYLLLKDKIKLSWLILIWALCISYSRIYLAVHYPIDVLVGGIIGVLTGLGFFRLYRLIVVKK